MGLSQAELVALLAKLGDRAEEESSEVAEPGFDFEAVRLRIREDLFPRQRAFFDDRSPMKAACCTRQCGKSFEVAREMTDVALGTPRAEVLYMTSDAAASRRIMWDDPEDGLPAVLRHYGMREGVEFELNNTTCTVRFPHNRSRIIVGSVAKESYDKRFEGPKPALLVFDEAHQFEDLERAVAAASPGLATRGGRVVLIGTPNPEYYASWFRQVTDTEEPNNLGFNVHRWGQVDNTRRPELVDLAHETKRRNGWSDDDPRWVGMYVGRWVRRADRMVFPVVGIPDADLYHDGTLPGRPSDWNFTAGADCGMDGFSWVVWAWSHRHPLVYEHDSFKMAGLDWEAWMEHLTGLSDRYDLERGGLYGPIWVDIPESTLSVWRERCRLNVVFPEKAGRLDQIDVMGSDIGRRKVRFRRGSPLLAEMMVLHWDPRFPWERRREVLVPGKFERHACDAGRYGYMQCRAYLQEHAEPDLRSMTEVERQAYLFERELEEVSEREDRGTDGLAWWLSSGRDDLSW